MTRLLTALLVAVVFVDDLLMRKRLPQYPPGT